MQVFFLPEVINGLIFDVDLTLYENREYYESMGPLMTERLAEEKGLSVEEMKAELDAVQKKYQAENDGRKLSIGNLFHRFGISFEENVRWRAELFQPEAYLSEDQQLIETLKVLQKHFKIAAVSNNATAIVERTLQVLGVAPFFESTIGLDISLKSKPTMIPFNMTAEKLNLPVTEIVSIGDRVEIDLELPMKHGMGGILIEKIADVYQLPEVLLKTNRNA
ncbi:Haloacid dehalogenase domain protein hydrolase [Chloroherpeton thalassium ATCC 35110]|uniref:Haloacid dehalogenase domain protein hydrolase n=1 Tax=Chloroherpeton thalassium (strain ATCC 35110 / GB-78) TaxID=517418 RepID=B3QSQ7_CHLT3|nr:HAD family hydrolase [Chloroherpeton thalassium]ACF14104.1 Haloacid dehalogenase domain protein hydrolase [Chloroherpeton thalassium ATCC 35110]